MFVDVVNIMIANIKERIQICVNLTSKSPRIRSFPHFTLIDDDFEKHLP